MSKRAEFTIKKGIAFFPASPCRKSLSIEKLYLTVTFPNTAVLYLRTYQKTPDKMKYVIVTPGKTVQYDVPVMKMQAFSLDAIADFVPNKSILDKKGVRLYNYH